MDFTYFIISVQGDTDEDNSNVLVTSTHVTAQEAFEGGFLDEIYQTYSTGTDLEIEVFNLKTPDGVDGYEEQDILNRLMESAVEIMDSGILMCTNVETFYSTVSGSDVIDLGEDIIDETI